MKRGGRTVKTALLLIAHGSRQKEANDDLFYLADCLRERGWSIVAASFLELAEPSIADGGAHCVEQGAECVILVPYFLSAGVHVRRDLSAMLERLAERFPKVAFRLAEPLGRHPLLIEVVVDRARAVESSEHATS